MGRHPLILIAAILAIALLYRVSPEPARSLAQWVADRTTAHTSPFGIPGAEHVGVPRDLYWKTYAGLVAVSSAALSGVQLAFRAARQRRANRDGAGG
jgi:hypothetical protein